VGDRWQDLGDPSRREGDDTVLPFLTIHTVRPGPRRANGADALLNSVRLGRGIGTAGGARSLQDVPCRPARVCTPTQRRISARVAPSFDRVCAPHRGGRQPCERDLFEADLLDAAIRSRLFGVAQQALALRRSTDRDGVRSIRRSGACTPNSGCQALANKRTHARRPPCRGIPIEIDHADDISDRCFTIVEARRDELVELAASADPLSHGQFRPARPMGPARSHRPALEARGFTVEYVRAQGTPGTDDRLSRIT